jgi:hypothetical protein
MAALGGLAISYERGTPVVQQQQSTRRCCADFIRTSIHDEYDLMLVWHMFWSILLV